ncbi:MAG: hypothetical protein OXI19_11910, partial [Gemmatimonadota bacterium]|nr:hypothetical protein [Gemmatimonadota bacterium]
MNHSTRHRARRLLQALAKLEFEDLIPHRLKRLSRRFLGVGFVVAAMVHLIVSGTVYWYRFLEPTVEELIELTPYPPFLVEVLIEDTLVTDEVEVDSAEPDEAASDPQEEILGAAGEEGGGSEGGGTESAEGAGDAGDEAVSDDGPAPAAIDASPPVLESEMTEMEEIIPVEASLLVADREISESEAFASAEIPPPTEVPPPAEAPPPSEMDEFSEPEEITPIELPPPVEESA